LGISNAASSIASWDPSKHPRAAAGSAGGGQFAPLSYNSKSNTGTGYGSRNGDDRVKAAQQALNKGKFTDTQGRPLKLDGKLGPKTTAAIKAYQRAHGLKPDGKITPALLKQLKSGKGAKSGPSAGRHKKAALKRPAAPKRTPPAAHRPSAPRMQRPIP
jgi:peptidoglycan hydrolase-like protein with peptidoglycan-binding domain